MKRIVYALAVLPLVFSCAKQNMLETQPAGSSTRLNPWAYIPQETVQGKGGPATIQAEILLPEEDAASKSQLAMNGAGTFASVVWTAGDNFRLLGFTSGESSMSSGIYTTASGGSSAEFSTTSGPDASKAKFYAVYPNAAYVAWTSYSGNEAGFLMGINFPGEQTATAGNVAEGANIAFAQAASVSESLHFKNVGAVIKFNLSGAAVSDVKKVIFKGSDYVSGCMLVEPNGTGGADLVPSLYFPSHPRSHEVSLVGDFVAGTDYYMVVAPSIQDTFMMVFENADGSREIKKMSGRTLTLNQGRITDFGTIALGDEFPVKETLTPYIEHTESKYATIAVIPDGYTALEMDQYEIDAKSGIDALFNTEPYKSYKGYFNVWILKVASNESGARISDGTPEERVRDCFFESSWGGSSYDSMKANSNRVFAFVENNCPDIVDGVHQIEDVPILVIINDNRYGGIAWNYGSGQTYCMVPHSYNGEVIGWNYPSVEAAGVNAVEGDTHTVTAAERTELGWTSAKGYTNAGTWRNTLVHEFGGHSIGKLSDEYWYSDSEPAVDAIEEHSWPIPMGLNVSAKPDQNLVPWHELFDSAIQAEMATKSPLYAQRVSVFQGADVSMFNRWRSEKISCMIDNRFYFSTWQRYIIVNRIMTLAGLPSLTVDEFLDNDVPTDPVRDEGGSPVMRPAGVNTAAVPVHEGGMLPPPVYVR